MAFDRFPLTTSGVSARQVGGDIELVGADGSVVGVMPAGVAFDAGDAGLGEPARTPVAVTLVGSGPQ